MHIMARASKGGSAMSRSAKPASMAAASERGAVSVYDDIESEFLGIWLGLARLREKIRNLAGHETTPRRPA